LLATEADEGAIYGADGRLVATTMDRDDWRGVARADKQRIRRSGEELFSAYRGDQSGERRRRIELSDGSEAELEVLGGQGVARRVGWLVRFDC
ncbi:MAG: hypothetical protein ABEL76_12355, partial [Bradymonadaceae bacterium]